MVKCCLRAMRQPLVPRRRRHERRWPIPFRTERALSTKPPPIPSARERTGRPGSSQARGPWTCAFMGVARRSASPQRCRRINRVRRLERCRSLALGFALCAMASGCYSYIAVPPSGGTVGEQVRVRVSGGQAERLEPVLGMTDREIEGQLLEQSDSSIVLSVPLPLPATGGAALERAHQRIIIPRSDLQEVERRKLDKTRTSLLVGAGVVALATVIAASTGAIELGSGGSRGSPNESRVPARAPLLLRWSFALP
jgi:hypothetical protein